MTGLMRALYGALAGEGARLLFFGLMMAAVFIVLFYTVKKPALPRIYGIMMFFCAAAALALDAGIIKDLWQVVFSLLYTGFFGYIAVYVNRGGENGAYAPPDGAYKKAVWMLAASVVVFMTAALLRTAWVCDDAYITARTADNFLNGFGLTWNSTERVQAYTHPLWMFVFTVVYYFLRDPFYSFVIMGFFFTAMTVMVLGIKLNDRFKFAFAALLLVLSKSFIDFSTSGLENPMLCLLALLFFIYYMEAGATLKKIFMLSFITSLAMLTRLDSALLFIMPLGFTVMEHKKKAGLLACAAGFIPLICWEAFSLYYYGFFVPNTYYAKMARGFSLFKYISSGLYYFWDSARLDLLTVLVMLAGICLPFYYRKEDLDNGKTMMLSAGILLYLLYFIRIGGDFMQGRFFSVPFLMAVLILTRQKRLFRPGVFITAVLFSFMLALAPSSYSFLLDKLVDNENKSVPPREFYAPGSSLAKITEQGSTKMLYNTFVTDALKHREDAKTTRQVYSIHAIGFPGYFAGPNVIIVDRLGIPDAFISHLKGKFFEKVGHIYRDLPDGYMDTLRTGNNMIKDHNLAEYYEKIKLITTGKLQDPERIKAIIKMNTGQYDYLLGNN